MKTKFEIKNWSFDDLYSKDFWDSLDFDTIFYEIELSDIWNYFTLEDRNFFWDNNFEMFAVWFDNLEIDEFIYYTDLIRENYVEFFNQLTDNEIYLDIISEYSNSLPSKKRESVDFSKLVELAKMSESTTLYFTDKVIVLGFQKNKVDDIVRNFVFNGYIIEDTIKMNNYNTSENVNIYTLKPNTRNFKISLS